MGELENTNSDCRFEFNMVRIPLGISFNKLRFPVENFHTSSSYDVISVFRFKKKHLKPYKSQPN